MAKFIFNDETVENSYGFTIPNKGIKLDRFLKNPIMLDEHCNSTDDVLGSWQDVAVNGKLLEGNPVFDIEDEDVAKIAGKVNRGFIKSCSMGVSFDRNMMKLQPDGKWILEECELFEVSIVAIPSNANAVRLFHKDGVEMTEDEVKLAVANLKIEPNFNVNNKDEQMEKVTLSIKALMALGLESQPTDSGVLDAKILKLSGDLEAERLAHEGTKKQFKEGEAERAKALVADAKLAGKITGAEEEQFVKDATENYSLTARLLSKLPSKTTLGATNTGQGAGSTDPKTVDEFEKLSVDAKLAFKTENPEGYKALFS